MTIKNPLDAGRATNNPGISDNAFRSKLEMPAGIHRTRNTFVDGYIDELDRGVATWADRALGFWRNLVGAATFETMNRLALAEFFSGKGRE